MTEEREHIAAYTRYVWDCPSCGNVNELENDPTGEQHECEDCSQPVKITEVR